MKENSLYIFGAGGLGGELKALINRLPEWSFGGFYDDGHKAGTNVHGSSSLGGIEDILKGETPINLILAIGDPVQKLKLSEKLSHRKNLTFPILIDPTAILLDSDSIRLEPGCVITAGCILTKDISLGKHTLVNLNTTIGHNTTIGVCCSIMPGVNIAGNVKLGDAVLIGSGTNLINQVKVGNHSRVGAGSVVTRDIESGKTVVGIPARELRRS